MAFITVINEVTNWTGISIVFNPPCADNERIEILSTYIINVTELVFFLY